MGIFGFVCLLVFRLFQTELNHVTEEPKSKIGFLCKTN